MNATLRNGPYISDNFNTKRLNQKCLKRSHSSQWNIFCTWYSMFTHAFKDKDKEIARKFEILADYAPENFHYL